jgi:hypothetical protein
MESVLPALTLRSRRILDIAADIVGQDDNSVRRVEINVR